jgi:hypothetical protein
VHKCNDHRAALKRKIDVVLGSVVVEPTLHAAIAGQRARVDRGGAIYVYHPERSDQDDCAREAVRSTSAGSDD